jgi:hypothetical protein
MILDAERSQWNDDERDVLRDNTAQAIHEQLETQDNLKPKYERRWIWELFQNALDAAGNGSEVKVHLTLGDSFVFAHNGSPFKRKEILHLIFHGSTKRELGKAIGRYGTGFLTTHVLSRRVQVRGQLDGGADFDFWLDRSGPTSTDLTHQMEASREQLLDSLSVGTQTSGRWTEFHYPVSVEASMVARAISDLSRIAIPVIAFNRKIRAIELSGKFQERYELLAEDHINPNCTLLKVGDPENEEKSYHLAVATDDEVAIAVPLEHENGLYRVASPTDVPRLFVAFPLFGTESVPFPFIMNSVHAIPTVDRDGLFLGGEDREDNLTNKFLVEKSWKLYQYLLDLSASQRWKGVHRLGTVSPTPKYYWLDSEWLDSVLRTNITNILVQSKIVNTRAGVVSPSEALFPIGLADEQFAELHSLTESLHGELVVKSDCASQWYQNLLGWHQLEAHVSLSEISLQTLSSKVVQLADVKTLAEALTASNDSFSWLNRLLLLLIQCKANWNSLALLPNQLEKFSTLLQLLRDDGIDPQLKEIADLLLEGIRAQLIDTRVAPEIQRLKPPLDQEKVVGVLLGAIRSRKSSVPTVSYTAANAKLLKWLIAKQRADDLKTYPFMLRTSDDHGVSMVATASAQLLAPSEVWAETAKRFVDLFPPDHVISSAYVEILSREDWTYLSSLGVCRLDPVFRTTRTLDPDEVSTMVQDVQSLETAEHTLAATEVSEVAFLGKEILDTSRNSKSKGMFLLQFLFDHVIPLSPADLEYRAIACSCRKSHAAHSAAWLVPVKSKKWVYESKNHPAYVSAVTLSRLIKDDASLMNRLAEDAIFTFLARLDVSPSDLQKAALNLPEQEMAKLERAVLGLLSATDNNPEQLEQIAELVSSAPELLAEFEKKKKAKERIHRNQQLGSLVEQLFDELFRSEEIKAMGLRLRREPIGSDFAVENDFVSGGQENLFGITGADRDLLIELKSTLGNTATMTHTQAGVAAGRSDSFVLCVVPLEDRQPTVDIVRNQSRFVPSIGQRLRPKVDEVRTIRNLQELTVQPTDGVQVVVEQGEFRYRVSESVWTVELSFEGFRQFLFRFFERTVVVGNLNDKP